MRLLKHLKKLVSNINQDELIFDSVMAVLLSLFQFGFVVSGAELLHFFPKWIIILFAYFIQIVLSFNFGQIIHKMSNYSCTRICNLFWSISLFFILFMLLFSGIGIIIELNLPEKTNLILFLVSFIVIFIFVSLGAIINDDVDLEEKKHFNKKLIIAGLSAVAFAFLNYGVATKFIGESSGNFSFTDFFIFILLMFVTGFLPFRLFMLLAPPKNTLNIIIAFVAITYEMVILYF